MIGAMIWVLCMGGIMLMGITYTAAMAYTVARKIYRHRRRRFEPTEEEDYIDGE